MTFISEEAKEAIIKKALSNNGQTITEIALENNIGRSTLSTWVRRFKLANNKKGSQGFAVDGSTMTSVERFKHLQATFGQESDMVGAYCRKHGLYAHQLTQWEAEFMTKTSEQKHLKKTNVELKGLRAEIKTLKHIIVRKDKVLAETVALLVLKKKAAQIWGEREED